MKPTSIKKVLGATLVALSLMVLPSMQPAQAQNTPTTDQNQTTIDTTPFQESESDNNHWGALGLLGLLGLLNLFRKPKPAVYADPEVERTSTTRY